MTNKIDEIIEKEKTFVTGLNRFINDQSILTEKDSSQIQMKHRRNPTDVSCDIKETEVNSAKKKRISVVKRGPQSIMDRQKTARNRKGMNVD